MIRSQPINQRLTLRSCGFLPPDRARHHRADALEARAQLAGERFGFLVRDAEERDPGRDQTAPTSRIFVAFVDPDSPPRTLASVPRM
jgi:hypothetical protein